MKYGMELGQGPERRVDAICFSDKLANARRFRFIEIEFCNIGGVEIHGG